MVTIDERLCYLILGCIIGYTARFLQERVVQARQRRNENGAVHFMRSSFMANAALFVVLSITVYAAFASQKASNNVVATQEELKSTQARLERLTHCNVDYLQKTIRALNERTQYSSQVARSNVALQEAQARFLSVAGAQPPKGEIEEDAALAVYRTVLQEFLDINTKSAVKADLYQYPTPKALNTCLITTKE